MVKNQPKPIFLVRYSSLITELSDKYKGDYKHYYEDYVIAKHIRVIFREKRRRLTSLFMKNSLFAMQMGLEKINQW